jgi:hypothetical protein
VGHQFHQYAGRSVTVTLPAGERIGKRGERERRRAATIAAPMLSTIDIDKYRYFIK